MAISNREARVRLAASLKRLKTAGSLDEDDADALNGMFSTELTTARKSTADLDGGKADELNELFGDEFVSRKATRVQKKRPLFSYS